MDPLTESTQEDLGFGSVVSEEATQRLLNRDGSFNVRRKGLGLRQSLSMYHYLIEMSWPHFVGVVSLVYVATNAVFAGLYMWLGMEAFPGLAAEGVGTGFAAYFFFSVHTIATIGYGNVVPQGVAANLIVTAEALVGLLAFGLGAGLMFARIARPSARILFSDAAIIAPYRSITGFEFRIANGRKSQIVDLTARVVLTVKNVDGSGRAYHVLSLERAEVEFFPLSWTIVHPIDEKSPLHGMTPADLARAEAEFLILIAGFDETFSQTVHARSSYRADEVLWDRRFVDIFDHAGAGEPLAVDIGRLSETTDVSE